MTWHVVRGPFPQQKIRDSERFLYIIERAGIRRDGVVELSGTMLASEPETLPSPLDDAVRTWGMSFIEQWPEDKELPQELRLSTVGLMSQAR